MKARLVFESLEFKRGGDPIDNLKIGKAHLVEKIITTLIEEKNSFTSEGFYYMEREVMEEIIKFLIDSGYNEDQILKFWRSEHMRWVYTDYRFSFDDFKRYWSRNTNEIKDFIVGNTDKGEKVEFSWGLQKTTSKPKPQVRWNKNGTRIR